MKVHASEISNGKLNGVLTAEAKKREHVLLIMFLRQPHGTPTISMILSLKIHMHYRTNFR